MPTPGHSSPAGRGSSSFPGVAKSPRRDWENLGSFNPPEKKEKREGEREKAGSLHALNLNISSFRSSSARCFPLGKVLGGFVGWLCPALTQPWAPRDPLGSPQSVTGGNWDCPGFGISQIPVVLKSWWQEEISGICQEEKKSRIHGWNWVGAAWDGRRSPWNVPGGVPTLGSAFRSLPTQTLPGFPIPHGQHSMEEQGRVLSSC